MAMNIQRGKVGYKGVDNYSCFFGAVGDNVYYFIDPNGLKLYYETDNLDVNSFKLPNGNFVVTSLLNEVVDPQIKAVNIGMINENGDVVLPLENRKIVKINGDSGLLLVEKAVPTSQSVLDAVEMRNDTSSATQLVSTAASIKDQITDAMGGEVGQYIFNDMLSEATITDYDGNNLLNGECYSFICMSGDGTKIALSKNAVSTVMIFDTASKTVVPVAAPQSEIDVTSTGTTGAIVEDAMANAGGEVVNVPTAPVVEEDLIQVADVASQNDGTGDLFDITVPEEDNAMTLPSADELNAFTVGEAGSEAMPTATESAPEVPVNGVEPVAEIPAGEIPVVPVGEMGTDDLMPAINPIADEGVLNGAPKAEEPTAKENQPDGEAPVGNAAPTETSAGEDPVVPVGEMEADDLMPAINPIADEGALNGTPNADEPLDVGNQASTETLLKDEIPVDGDGLKEEGEAPLDSGQHDDEPNSTKVGDEFELTDNYQIPKVESDAENSTDKDDNVEELNQVEGLENDDSLEEPFEEMTPDSLFDVAENNKLIPQDDIVGGDTSPVTELEEAMAAGPRAIDPSEVASKVDKDGDGVLDSDVLLQKGVFTKQSHDVPQDEEEFDLGNVPLGTTDANGNQFIDSASELMMPVSDRDYLRRTTSSYPYDGYYPQYPSDTQYPSDNSDSALMQKVATTLKSLINNDKLHRSRLADETRINSDLRARLASSEREIEKLRYTLDEQRGEIAELRRQAQGSEEIRRLLSESQELLNSSEGRGYYRRAA